MARARVALGDCWLCVKLIFGNTKRWFGMEENAGACNLCEENAMGANGCSRETRCPSFGGQQMCPIDIGTGSTEGPSLVPISLQPSLGRNPPKHHAPAQLLFASHSSMFLLYLEFIFGWASPVLSSWSWLGVCCPAQSCQCGWKLVGGRGQQMMARVHMPAIPYIPAGSEHPGTVQSWRVCSAVLWNGDAISIGGRFDLFFV